ncbi:D-alanyl-D-alanine carboxypeptidase/D-alanyl-D-alanine endopeptidase [Halorussus halobius]|uniref:D-alanyl-D-alanine carboxypeptidase/D-alanyl-D-alanine endopeptidase n=1 Tax=Halorussus halobius TaxID=1710537 RepID=UPI00143D2147|nr:D-alanyl-D-alanine carboxypeptidase/D-alanyl-D-alanine-endopeptidase [Halorussus halobius]
MTDPTTHLTDIEGASVSALARDEHGEVVASHDADRALAPASNTKLLTVALALDVLGPDYRFETRVEGHGSARDGRLDGDLVVVGTGQPDLGYDDLEKLARNVAEEVEVVRGDLQLDGSRFGDQQLGPGWTWGDQRYYYGARSTALALDGNLLTVEVTCDESGDFEVGVAPDTGVVAVESDIDVGEDDLRIYAAPETGVIRVEGSLPAGTDRTERAPVAEPERHFGEAFREALAEAGVDVAGEVRVGRGLEGTPEFSARVESEPLSHLAREMTVHSDNFVAEQLARTVAAERSDDRTGTWELWSDLATDFLEERGAVACRIRDGSGLSRYNLVTARALVNLLEWAREQPWADAFRNSLPESGEGTLRNRLGDVPGVRAKTGTLTGASALSGVLHRDGDPDVTFSVVFGGLAGDVEAARQRQDAFVRALR